MVATQQKRKKNKRKKRGKSPVEYSLVELSRIRNRIMRVTCSRPWTDRSAELCQAYGIPPESKDVVSALALYHIYPPPSENTPMQPCNCHSCKGVKLWPAHYMRSSGVSTECAYERMPRSIMERLEGSVAKIRMRGGMRGRL